MLRIAALVQRKNPDLYNNINTYFIYLLIAFKFPTFTDPLQLIELDRLIGSTHNHYNRHSMTISDQSVPMFQDEDTHQIQRTMGSIGHIFSTIQGFTRSLSWMTPGLFYYLVGISQQPYSTIKLRCLLGMSLMRQGCSSITLLDQKSLSQAWIECGNQPL